MPARKNQHFIPQMYLRLFAGEGGRHIRVLPLSTGIVVERASVRDQASGPWFYDRDGTVEESLGRFETATAPIIAGILRRDRPPIRCSPEHQGLAMFLAIQLTRTQAAADDANERTDKVAKALLRQSKEGDPRLADIDRIKVVLTNPAAQAMRPGFIGSPLLYDLRMKMIVNANGTPFITSDAPVVLHNRWHEGSGAPALGLANSGLQVVVPLGPWRALLLYDEGVYEVGSPASSSVRLVNPAHAETLNELQWQAARRVVFAPPTASAADLEEACRRWTSAVADRVLVEHVELSRDSSRIRTRLGVGNPPSRIRLDLPFVRTRAAPPPPWDGSDHARLRHPEWAEHVTTLARAVDRGDLHPARFLALTLKVPRTARRARDAR